MGPIATGLKSSSRRTDGYPRSHSLFSADVLAPNLAQCSVFLPPTFRIRPHAYFFLSNEPNRRSTSLKSLDLTLSTLSLDFLLAVYGVTQSSPIDFEQNMFQEEQTSIPFWISQPSSCLYRIATLLQDAFDFYSHCLSNKR